MDELLIRRAQNGNESAFIELEKGIHRLIWSACWQYMGNMQDAEDAFQESILRIWTGLNHYKPTGPFEAWAYKVSVKVCLNILEARKAKKRGSEWTQVDLPEGMEPASPDENVEKEVIHREEQERLRQAILQLPDEQRDAVILTQLERKSYEEVAQMFQVAQGTIKSRVNRGIRQLKILMSETPSPRTG